MADVPCDEQQQTVDRLLTQFDEGMRLAQDAAYQLPAAMYALTACLRENYPPGMVPEPGVIDQIAADIQRSCERIEHHVGLIHGRVIDAKIERKHKQDEGK